MSQQAVAKRSGYRTVVGGILVAIGTAMLIVGIVAWFAISGQLKAQHMTVPDDALSNGGKVVSGPLTAWSMQEIISVHAGKATDGKTYAELGQVVDEAKEQYGEDSEEAAKAQGQRNTAMNASFLRSSLFTSILAFGVSLLAMGTGVAVGLTGTAFLVRRHTRQ